MTILSSWIRLVLIMIVVTVGKVTSVSADDCDAGTFYNATTDSCVECPVGQYQPNSARTSCIKCPKGTRQKLTGQKNISSCVDCKVGWMAGDEGSEWCSECPSGTFTNKTKSENCDQCEPGTHNNSTGKGKCDLCPPGTFQNESEQKNCKPCSAGHYNNQWGKVNCKACDGNVSADRTACNGGGSDVCQPGTYKDGLECKSCSPGTYQNITDADKCRPCEIGTFMAAGGATSCKNCPVGTATQTEGSKRCEECDREMCVFAGKCFDCSAIKNCHDGDSGFHDEGSGFCHACSHQCKDEAYLFSVAGISITMEMVTIFCGCLLFLLSFCIFFGCWRCKKRKNKVSSIKRRRKFEQNPSPSKSQLIITIRSQRLDHLPIDLDF